MYVEIYIPRAYANPAQVRILPAAEGMMISIHARFEGEGPSTDRSRSGLELMTTPLEDDATCAGGF